MIAALSDERATGPKDVPLAFRCATDAGHLHRGRNDIGSASSADCSTHCEDQNLGSRRPGYRIGAHRTARTRGRSMHSIGYADGLYPAQWTALRYFSKAVDGIAHGKRAGPFPGFCQRSGQPHGAHADLQGPAAQGRQPAGRPRRASGDHRRAPARLLDHDPTRAIAEAIAGLSDAEKAALERALKAVIKSASGVWPREDR